MDRGREPDPGGARLLAAGHKALKRWIDAGDLPVVLSRYGHVQVPVRALLELREAVDSDRERRCPALRADALDDARAARTPNGSVSMTSSRATSRATGHDRALARSLAYHRAVARAAAPTDGRGGPACAVRVAPVGTDCAVLRGPLGGDPRPSRAWRFVRRLLSGAKRPTTSVKTRRSPACCRSPSAGAVDLSQAERGGFEPPDEFPRHTISSRARSAAPAPLQENRGDRLSCRRVRAYGWAVAVVAAAAVAALLVVVMAPPADQLIEPAPARASDYFSAAQIERGQDFRRPQVYLGARPRSRRRSRCSPTSSGGRPSGCGGRARGGGTARSRGRRSRSRRARSCCRSRSSTGSGRSTSG